MNDAMFLRERPDLIERYAHLHTELLHLVAARDDTAVVAGQHHYGLVVQVGTEDPFTTDEEIVAVDEGVHD